MPVLTCLLATVALLWSEYRQLRVGIWIAKIVASTAFVWAALEAGAWGSVYGHWLLGGLALCWLGDVLLILRSSPVLFKGGIGAFLLGHLAYATAFNHTGLGLNTAGLAGGAVVLTLFCLVVWRWLRPHLPADFVAPVAAYLLVIASMVTMASGAVVAGGPWLLGVGAVAFAISDLSVARDRFITAGFVNTGWGLPLYYLAQLALAYSVP